MDFKHLLGLLNTTSQLDEPSLRMGGDTNTVMNTSPTSLLDWSANAAAVSLRAVYDTSDLAANSWMVMPLGQSAVPGSEHYGDRTPAWHSGATPRILEVEAEVKASARYQGTFDNVEGAGSSRMCCSM